MKNIETTEIKKGHKIHFINRDEIETIKSNRKYIMIEKEQEYYDISVNRIEQFYKNKQ